MPFQDTHPSPKKILAHYNIKPKKGLGQHFLMNPFTAYQIVKKIGIEKEDIVIEIGAGFGALTIPLAENAKKVIAIEYDKRFIPILKEILKDFKNIEVWQGDALKYNYENTVLLYNKKIKIVGNLPYYLTSPLLFLFLEKKALIKNMGFMVQKEVAERLLSPPGKKTYGLLSILYSLTANVTSLMTLAPASFYPKPEVFSQLIKIEWKEEIFIEKEFIEFLKYIFSHRRKTIFNILKNRFKQKNIKNIFSQLNIDSNTRPEKVSPFLFFKLYHLIK